MSHHYSMPSKSVPSSNHHNHFQVHFEHDQFENRRADGRRKLRWNAVPTLFPGRTIKLKKPHTVPKLPPPTEEHVAQSDHSYSSLEPSDKTSSVCKCQLIHDITERWSYIIYFYACSLQPAEREGLGRSISICSCKYILLLGSPSLSIILLLSLSSIPIQVSLLYDWVPENLIE